MEGLTVRTNSGSVWAGKRDVTPVMNKNSAAARRAYRDMRIPSHLMFLFISVSDI
jgi:hypothetical protein